jgi:hypothetical protein
MDVTHFVDFIDEIGLTDLSGFVERSPQLLPLIPGDVVDTECDREEKDQKDDSDEGGDKPSGAV